MTRDMKGVYLRYAAAQLNIDQAWAILDGVWNEEGFRGTKDGDFLLRMWSFLGDTSDTLEINVNRLKKIAEAYKP